MTALGGGGVEACCLFFLWMGKAFSKINKASVKLLFTSGFHRTVSTTVAKGERE